MKSYVYISDVTLVCEYSGLKKDVANHISEIFGCREFVKHIPSLFIPFALSLQIFLCFINLYVCFLDVTLVYKYCGF